MTTERPEVVLAEALRTIIVPASYEEWQASVDRSYETDAATILAACAARGYTLSKSAPDPEPPRDRIDEANALGYREGYRTAEARFRSATPPAEPAP